MNYNYNDYNGGDVFGTPPQSVPFTQPSTPPPDTTHTTYTTDTTYSYNRSGSFLKNEPPEPISTTPPPAPREIWHEATYSEIVQNNTKPYTPSLSVSTTTQQRTKSAEKQPKRKGGFLRAVSLMLICVILSSAAAYGVTEYRIQRGDLTPINNVVIGNPSVTTPSDLTTPIISTGSEMDPRDIYDMACEQVVGVKTEVPMSSIGGYRPNQTESATIVSGSGFIITTDGYILTNYHVVETAYRGNYPIKAVMYDGTTFDASVVGFESDNDVAVLKINAENLNAVTTGNSDNLRGGQTVYAVGNPLGDLDYTMTPGMISALDRNITVDSATSINMFQFSAAVNSGNSGGPVYDAKGAVVGVVTAKYSNTGVEGIGFAIPINAAIDIATELITNGYVSGKAYMGITVETVTSTYSEYFGMPRGAYVRAVEPGSCAESAGLKLGDIIIKMGSSAIATQEDLILAKRDYKPGDSTEITVMRSGEELVLTITFDEAKVSLP